MLSPGSATALVNDALAWLRPEITHMLSATPANAEHETQGGCQGRQDRATALGMLRSALAAVLNFLAAHVTARQVPVLVTAAVPTNLS